MRVLVADMASIAACADIKYAPLEGLYPITDPQEVGRGSLSETCGQMYLEKIVQIQFDLPMTSVHAMQRLVRSSFTREASHDERAIRLRKLKLPHR